MDNESPKRHCTEPPCCFDWLPTEIVVSILEEAGPDLFPLLRFVCKRWYVTISNVNTKPGIREGLCAYVAKHGYFSVLKWARANGCPWNEWTCANAAANGYLEVLKWARANNCPWDWCTCFFAAENGQLETLEWARANGCPE